MKTQQFLEDNFQQIEENHHYATGFCEHEPLDIGDEESPYTICTLCEKKLKEWYE